MTNNVLSPERVFRAAGRRLPAGMRGPARGLYHALRPAERPSGVRIRYSDDVADRAALFDYLIDTDVFGAARAECENYVRDSIERFRITASLIDQIVRQGAVLELGSNPYFITRLLRRRGLDVTSANWFGNAGPTGGHGSQTVTGLKSGERHVFEFDHFNVEADRFPYADGAFDLVLCCEILEHLPHDPIHMLAEIHRVLRPETGRVLLTTPNAVRMDNLDRMLHGSNVYEELSGYGVYGRHNREYTVAELRSLLEECGFADLYVFDMDIHDHVTPNDVRYSGADLTARGDNLFAVARSSGESRWPYPPWLYASRHALARIVRDDVRMGFNDVLQTSGFHELERDSEGPFRWTGSVVAHTNLTVRDAGTHMLRVEGRAPPPSAGAGLQLDVRVNGQNAGWAIECDGKPFVLTARVDVAAGGVDVAIATSTTWRPADVSDSTDIRSLGVRISRVVLEP